MAKNRRAGRVKTGRPLSTIGDASGNHMRSNYVRSVTGPADSSETRVAPSDRDIGFASYVLSAHRSALEALAYFNSCQNRVWGGIVETVERFGSPELLQEGDRLRLVLRQLPEAQSLFVVERSSGRPLGLALYVRPDHEHLAVLHLSIAEEFASGGSHCGEQLLLKLLRELRRSGRRVKGIERLNVCYHDERHRNSDNRRSDVGAVTLTASRDV